MKSLIDIIQNNNSILEDSDMELEKLCLESEEGSKDLTLDRNPIYSMSLLSEIISMADDLYNTLSELDGLDIATEKEVESVHKHLDSLFVMVDNKFDISTTHDLENDDIDLAGLGLEEEFVYALNESFSSESQKVLDKIGFKVAVPSKKTYNRTSGSPIDTLYGLPMRAGKWADNWVYSLEDGTYHYADLEGVESYRTEKALIQDLKKVALGEATKIELDEFDLDNANTFWYKLNKGKRESSKTAFLKAVEEYKKAGKIKPVSYEKSPIKNLPDRYNLIFNDGSTIEAFVWKSKDKATVVSQSRFGRKNLFVGIPPKASQVKLNESLSASDPVEDWIDDFLKSDAPQFKDKTKKEIIKMALAAKYSAEKDSKK